MIDEHVAVPFGANVLGVPVTVREVELTANGRIVARCERAGVRKRASRPRWV